MYSGSYTRLFHMHMASVFVYVHGCVFHIGMLSARPFGFVYSQMLYTTTRCQAQHAYTPLPYIVYKHISTHMQRVWISQASMLNATVLTLELALEANKSI